MRRILAIFLAGWLLLLAIPAAQTAATCPRIISQSPYITHTLNWLGLGDCIVGVSRYDKLDRPHTGGVMDPDADAIAALHPDLLFTSDWTDPDVLELSTPEGTQAFRLHGFQHMSQVEDNLRTIATAAGLPDPEAQVQRFAKAWRKAARTLEGGGKKALLLSACGGAPYSFGPDTWLYDLFTEAGFRVVETHPRLRNIGPGEEVTDINTLVNRLKPQVLFVFEPRLSEQCRLITPKVPVRIVTLDGSLFLHPAPVLLQALEGLQTRRSAWSQD